MVMSAPVLLPPRPRTADRDALYWDRWGAGSPVSIGLHRGACLFDTCGSMGARVMCGVRGCVDVSVCRDVYEQVFVSESAALLWAAWHSDKGDPAQPFHTQVRASRVVCA